MDISHWLQKKTMKIADGIYARRKQAMPSVDKLEACKIVAHRGAHGDGVKENTLAAFDRAAQNGVWGLEMDLRWTIDFKPVIHHDPDLTRIFDADQRLDRITLKALKERFPEIPTLAEVIGRYGKSTHLMLEIKAEPYPKPEYQQAVLKDHLCGLTPGRDFHLLALDPILFEQVPFVPPETFLPVGELNLAAMSRQALSAGYGGVLGHYAIFGRNRIRRHQACGQSVGTAYVRSLNCLYRELNRGVDWIFSNHAANLRQKVAAVIASWPDSH